jgi:hypothetical protein
MGGRQLSNRGLLGKWMDASQQDRLLPYIMSLSLAYAGKHRGVEGVDVDRDVKEHEDYRLSVALSWPRLLDDWAQFIDCYGNRHRRRGVAQIGIAYSGIIIFTDG